MTGTTAEHYIPLAARVNHDSTVDVLIDGAVVPGGAGLTMNAVLELLARYASESGKVLLTTTHLNGRVIRDLVSETGEITPFYKQVEATAAVDEAWSDPTQETLLRALRNGSQQRIAHPDVDSAPLAPVAPETTRVMLGEGSIPKFDVEADVAKAMAAKKPPTSTAKTLVMVTFATVAILAGIAAAGWYFLLGPSGIFG